MLSVAFPFCNAACRYAEKHYPKCRYAECRYAEYRGTRITFVLVRLPFTVMPSVIRLSVIMVIVVVPSFSHEQIFHNEPILSSNSQMPFDRNIQKGHGPMLKNFFVGNL